jgi:hypothetical protein
MRICKNAYRNNLRHRFAIEETIPIFPNIAVLGQPAACIRIAAFHNHEFRAPRKGVFKRGVGARVIRPNIIDRPRNTYPCVERDEHPRGVVKPGNLVVATVRWAPINFPVPRAKKIRAGRERNLGRERGTSAARKGLQARVRLLPDHLVVGRIVKFDFLPSPANRSAEIFAEQNRFFAHRATDAAQCQTRQEPQKFEKHLVEGYMLMLAAQSYDVVTSDCGNASSRKTFFSPPRSRCGYFARHPAGLAIRHFPSPRWAGRGPR